MISFKEFMNEAAGPKIIDSEFDKSVLKGRKAWIFSPTYSMKDGETFETTYAEAKKLAKQRFKGYEEIWLLGWE